MPLLIEITFQDGHYHIEMTEIFSDPISTTTDDRNEVRKTLKLVIAAARAVQKQIIAADHTNEFLDLFQDFNEINV